MSLINKLISWFYEIDLPIELDESESKNYRENKYDSVKYNPATGLPMVGGLDIMVNIIRTDRRSDFSHHNNSMNDHYRYYSR